MGFDRRVQLSLAGFGVLLSMVGTPAHADGVNAKKSFKDPPEPAPLWQGFYMGGHIGGAWSDIAHDESASFLFPNGDQTFFGPGGLSGSGVFGGVQAGYNWQNSHCCLVYGVEFDVGGIDIGNSGRSFVVPSSDPATFAAFSTTGNSAIYGDLTARLGYGWNNALLYAKGGFAWLNTDISIKETLVAGNSVVFASKNNALDGTGTLTGWTVGAGLEYMINPNWSLKVEYLHFNFVNNSTDCCSDGVNNLRFLDNDLIVDTVKMGFNYIFRPESTPLK